MFENLIEKQSKPVPVLFKNLIEKPTKPYIPIRSMDFKGVPNWPNPNTELPDPIDENEIFLPVTDMVVPNIMPNRYFISNYGRIWDCCFERFLSYSFNKPYNEDGTNYGYYKTKMAYFSDPYTLKSKDVYIHRAVKITHDYVPGCQWGKELDFNVDHIDCNKRNNKLDNLDWVTNQENNIRAVKNKDLTDPSRIIKGELDLSTVKEICEMLSQQCSIRGIARKFGISEELVKEIKSRKKYTYISSQYTFSNNLKLEPAVVELICQKLENGEFGVDICREFNIDRHLLGDIRSGKKYADISQHYNIPQIAPQRHGALADSIVRDICERIVKGETNEEIAKLYNMNKHIISCIRSKRSYTYISKDYDFDNLPSITNETSDEIVHEICKLLLEKKTHSYIAEKTGTSMATVSRIRNKLSHKDISDKYF